MARDLPAARAKERAPAVIDIFTLLLVHGVMFVALYRLMGDDRLDSEDAAPAEGSDGRPTRP